MVITTFQISAYVAKCNSSFLRWGHEADFASADDGLVTLSKNRSDMHCYMASDVSVWYFLYLESLNIETLVCEQKYYANMQSDPVNEILVCYSCMHQIL
jgi:hypothetical protein